MLVFTLPPESDYDDLKRFSDFVEEQKIGRRRTRTPLIVGAGITVQSLPDAATFRAKRGHTPRWTRQPLTVRRTP
jgi:hypothetical protein